jgi:hypothetical protein
MIIPEDKEDTTLTFVAGDKFLDKKIIYTDLLFNKLTDLNLELKELMDIIGSDKINISELEELETINTKESYEKRTLFDNKLKTFIKGNYMKIITELDRRIETLIEQTMEEKREFQIKLKDYLENLDWFEFILGLEYQLKNNGYEINNIILNQIFKTYVIGYKNQLSELQLLDSVPVSSRSSWY